MERDSARGRTSVDSSPAGGDSPSRVTRLRMDEVQAQDGEQDRGLDHEEHNAGDEDEAHGELPFREDAGLEQE